MAPTSKNRSRPAFSPPRPGKSRGSNSVKQNLSGGAKRAGSSHGHGVTKSQKTAPAQKSAKKPRPQKRRGFAGTMRAILGDSEEDNVDDDERPARARAVRRNRTLPSDGSGSSDDEVHRPGPDNNKNDRVDHDDDDNDDDDDDDLAGEQSMGSLTPDQSSSRSPSSPGSEPDFILAEITHTANNTTSSSDQGISVALVQHIMHAHFKTPDQSISSDAKVLVGKYVEVFVKEAIRRCVDEKRELEGVGTAGAVGRARERFDVDSGWLELEDLERIAPQLVLDF